MDTTSIQLGERWDSAVSQGLSECDTVAVLLSKAAVASQTVLDEISVALDKNLRVIPIVLEDCQKPLRLTRLQHIVYDETAATALRIVETVRRSAIEGTTQVTSDRAMGFDDSKDWEELVLVPWKPKPWVVVTLNIFVPGFVAAIFAFALNARAGAIAFLAVVGMNFIGFLHKKEELPLTLTLLGFAIIVSGSLYLYFWLP